MFSISIRGKHRRQVLFEVHQVQRRWDFKMDTSALGGEGCERCSMGQACVEKPWKDSCSLLYDKYVKIIHVWLLIHMISSYVVSGHNSYHSAIPCPHDIFLLDRMDIPMGLRFGTQENLSRLNRFFMRKEDLQAMISGRFRGDKRWWPSWMMGSIGYCNPGIGFGTEKIVSFFGVMDTCIPVMCGELWTNPPVDRKIIKVLRLWGWSGEDDEFFSPMNGPWPRF